MEEELFDKPNEAILKVTNPPIATFFHNDIPLIIIYDDPETHPWIFSNFIELYSTNNEGEACFIDFYHSMDGAFRFLELSSCPWLLFERISRKDIVNHWPGILEFAKEKINENKYIGITVAARKIENYLNLDKHNLFIYGYSDKKNVLYAADHFKHGVLSFEEVKYDEFIQSVMYSYDEDLNWGNLEGVCAFSKIKRQHKNIYDLNVKKIINNMKSYLLEDNLLKNDDYYIYGIECYDNLIKYYKLVIQNALSCDIKGISIEISHKKMMILRTEFLNKIGYDVSPFIDVFTNLKNRLNTVQSFVMKYNITGDKSNLFKGIDYLMESKIEETDILRKLIKKLENKI